MQIGSDFDDCAGEPVAALIADLSFCGSYDLGLAVHIYSDFGGFFDWPVAAAIADLDFGAFADSTAVGGIAYLDFGGCAD